MLCRHPPTQRALPERVDVRCHRSDAGPRPLLRLPLHAFEKANADDFSLSHPTQPTTTHSIKFCACRLPRSRLQQTASPIYRNESWLRPSHFFTHWFWAPTFSISPSLFSSARAHSVSPSMRAVFSSFDRLIYWLKSCFWFYFAIIFNKKLFFVLK